MAFIAARLKYKLQSGHGEGKYVIRICIVGICSILARLTRSFYLLRPCRARFCSYQGRQLAASDVWSAV